MEKEYKLGSIVMMKKNHPCGENKWEITRLGADIKIKCLKQKDICRWPKAHLHMSFTLYYFLLDAYSVIYFHLFYFC